MKKLVLGIAIVATLVVALLTAGYVFAQSTSPTPQAPGSGYGRGMMGFAGTDAEGPMHDAMIAAFAQKLGITVDDLNARLAKGETMAQIAASKGLTSAEFYTLMTDARSQAIDQAVKDGTLSSRIGAMSLCEPRSWTRVLSSKDRLASDFSMPGSPRVRPWPRLLLRRA